MPTFPFEKSVFINCPFDDDYEPILQAICFCIISFGLHPRLATERHDAGEARLEKIISLITSSKYSIHDLSRCESSTSGEPYRMNMPFELGVDLGCKRFKRSPCSSKVMLILEKKKYRYQVALSDLSGSDIEAHDDNYEKAIRKVWKWLLAQGLKLGIGAAKIVSDYEDFQEWYFEKMEAAGHSEDDIYEYPTTVLLAEMKKWIKLGKPVT